MNMRTIFVLAFGTLVVTGAAIGLGPLSSAPAPEPEVSIPPEVTIVEAIPFRLDTPMIHWWRSERPRFDRGALLVLKTAPDKLLQRQAAAPVLFCGDETVQILNHGYASGYAIVVVPFFGTQSIDDLDDACLFFGIAELPERLSKNDCRSEFTSARNIGTPTIGRSRLSEVRRGLVHVRDEVELYRRAGALVATYSPGEQQRIEWLRGK